jgi:hypothetical protein
VNAGVLPSKQAMPKLNNEELHNLYSSPNIIRMTISNEDEFFGACSIRGGDEKCTQNFSWEA